MVIESEESKQTGKALEQMHMTGNFEKKPTNINQQTEKVKVMVNVTDIK